LEKFKPAWEEMAKDEEVKNGQALLKPD
jgi:hypothetical protein